MAEQILPVAPNEWEVRNKKKEKTNATYDITKTYLYNFDTLKPHFYIVKLGFTVVYIIFLISAQNIDCRCSLEPPRRGSSNEYHNLCFWAEIWKISGFFLSENFQILEVKFLIYFRKETIDAQTKKNWRGELSWNGQ